MDYQDSLYSFIKIGEENKISPLNDEFKSELVINFSKNPLFEHLILHIKSYLKLHSTSSKEKIK
jgi:hypothetical protein